MSPRVLVCDDHPIVRDAIAVCLRSIAPDCEVGVCASARQAVERLAEPRWWDLVVLDLSLPDARGVEALIRIRSRQPAVKVAVLTAQEDRNTRDLAMRAGATAFLPKSFDRGSLEGSLRGLLGLPMADAATGAGRAASRAADDDRIHEAISGMSPRQLQVLRLMVRGMPNKEMCLELGLSENTVKIHISAVLRALCARNRTEAVALASRVGFAAAGH
jgi:DNA-binding NarL/FixJ family response regulator